MNDKDTVKLGYSAPSNSSFEGVWDTGFTRAEWDKMSEKERDQELADALFALVDIWVLGED